MLAKGRRMNSEKAIAKIHEFERFGSILGLERMNMLLEILGNPQDDLKVIHVAGTNGKGSICRYIYSVLQAAGYKTGLYTSPFIEVFNERIELDEKYISDEDLAIYTDKVLAAAQKMTDEGNQSPTEFEVVTAIAFLYFKEKNCDYVVLEVGLGGSGDSTNVCKSPLMTVIASISMDHMDRLGDTIEEIAADKAGIIKDNCPLVTSAKNEKALKVIEEVAVQHNSPIFKTAGIPVEVKEETLKGYKFDVDLNGNNLAGVEISMTGRHQIENAVAAITALTVLKEKGDVTFSEAELKDGIKNARQPGRFEVMLEQNPTVIIDGAHNEDGAKALVEAVNTLCKGKKILMVTGMLADKDIDSITNNFMKITHDFIITEPDNPRKLGACELAAHIEQKGGRCLGAEADYSKAYKLAVEAAKDYDAVIFAGSLYLIGKIRSLITADLQNEG